MAAGSASEELEKLREDNANLIDDHCGMVYQLLQLEGVNKTQLEESNQWKKLAEERAEVINEQGTTINKLEKRIAKMQGPEKIQKEILALKKELKERERELELAEEQGDI